MSIEHEKPSGCLTLTLWCLPSFITSIVLLFCISVPAVGVIVSLALYVFLGHAWANTDIRLSHDGDGPLRHELWFKVTVFVLAQIVIVPVLTLSIAYGVCMMLGGPPQF